MRHLLLLLFKLNQLHLSDWNWLSGSCWRYSYQPVLFDLMKRHVFANLFFLSFFILLLLMDGCMNGTGWDGTELGWLVSLLVEEEEKSSSSSVLSVFMINLENFNPKVRWYYHRVLSLARYLFRQLSLMITLERDGIECMSPAPMLLPSGAVWCAATLKSATDRLRLWESEIEIEAKYSILSLKVLLFLLAKVCLYIIHYFSAQFEALWRSATLSLFFSRANL